MLLGKTIVITGIASGIGARIGELAIAMGADVIGVDINTPATPVGAFIKADLGSPSAAGEVAECLPLRFDALVNVAGVSGLSGARTTLAINFYGLRALSEALAPRMREGGAVVNVASIAGYGWRANLERTKAMIAPAGFPDIAALAKDVALNFVGKRIVAAIGADTLLRLSGAEFEKWLTVARESISHIRTGPRGVRVTVKIASNSSGDNRQKLLNCGLTPAGRVWNGECTED